MTPRDLGRHSLASELRYNEYLGFGGNGLDHASIVHLRNCCVVCSVNCMLGE